MIRLSLTYFKVPNFYYHVKMPRRWKKNLDHRDATNCLSRRRSRGGGEHKSTRKYLAIRRQLAEEWSAHHRRISRRQLIEAGHTPYHKDDKYVQYLVRAFDTSERGRSRSKRSGKRDQTYKSLSVADGPSRRSMKKRSSSLGDPSLFATSDCLATKIARTNDCLEHLRRQVAMYMVAIENAENSLENTTIQHAHTHPTSYV